MANQQNIQKIVGIAEGATAAAAGSGWFTYQWWTDTVSFVSMISGLLLTWLGILVMIRKLRKPVQKDVAE